MERIKFKTDTWDNGRKLTAEIERVFGFNHDEINGDLIIDNQNFYYSCHFDSRGFSYILIKVHNEAIMDRFLQLKKDYT